MCLIYLIKMLIFAQSNLSNLYLSILGRVKTSPFGRDGFF